MKKPVFLGKIEEQERERSNLSGNGRNTFLFFRIALERFLKFRIAQDRFLKFSKDRKVPGNV